MTDFTYHLNVWHYEERLYGTDVCAAFFDYCYLERQVSRTGSLWKLGTNSDVPWSLIRRWVYLTVPSYLSSALAMKGPNI